MLVLERLLEGLREAQPPLEPPQVTANPETSTLESPECHTVARLVLAHFIAFIFISFVHLVCNPNSHEGTVTTGSNLMLGAKPVKFLGITILWTGNINL